MNKYIAVGLLQILYRLFVEDFKPISPLEPEIELIASKYTYSWLVDGKGTGCNVTHLRGKSKWHIQSSRSSINSQHHWQFLFHEQTNPNPDVLSSERHNFIWTSTKHKAVWCRTEKTIYLCNSRAESLFKEVLHCLKQIAHCNWGEPKTPQQGIHKLQDLNSCVLKMGQPWNQKF